METDWNTQNQTEMTNSLKYAWVCVCVCDERKQWHQPRWRKVTLYRGARCIHVHHHIGWMMLGKMKHRSTDRLYAIISEKRRFVARYERMHQRNNNNKNPSFLHIQWNTKYLMVVYIYRLKEGRWSNSIYQLSSA